MARFLDVEVQGGQKIRRQLLRGAEAAGNMRPSLLLVREDMFRVMRANFTSQGRRYGGSWKQLNPNTVAQKARNNLDPRILIARGRLVDSLSKRTSRYMRTSVTRDQIKLGSTLPYVEAQNYGIEGHIPARPFIKFNKADRVRWVKILENELMGAMNGR